MRQPVADESNIGLIVPRFEEFPAFYKAADQMGFHSLWVTEMLFNRAWTGKRGLDPFGALAAAAAATSRIRLLTAVKRPMKHPILSHATEIANMDYLSGGRLSLGLSQDERWPGEGQREALRPKVGGRLKETITVLKSLWSEAEVSFKGSHFHLERASVDVRPVQVGGIPLRNLVSLASLPEEGLIKKGGRGWTNRRSGIPSDPTGDESISEIDLGVGPRDFHVFLIKGVLMKITLAGGGLNLYFRSNLQSRVALDTTTNAGPERYFQRNCT